MADFFDRIVILKRTPIFSEVTTDDLRVVVEEMQEEAYFKGERVFEINDPSDRIALNGIAEAFPGRTVIGIHAVDLVWGLGTLHCLTQQQPAGTAASK